MAAHRARSLTIGLDGWSKAQAQMTYSKVLRVWRPKEGEDRGPLSKAAVSVVRMVMVDVGGDWASVVGKSGIRASRVNADIAGTLQETGLLETEKRGISESSLS